VTVSEVEALGAVEVERAAEGARSNTEARFMRLLAHRRLPVWLTLATLLLCAPCLFIGFHLDDWMGRYVYLDGSENLYRIISGGYGLANGVPADSLWLAEHGWAPWWIYPKLLLVLYRPVGLATHILDSRLWNDSAFAMHAHSLAWLALLVLAATRMYRGVLGALTGGLAAILFAFDHTHGFEIGMITNRHTLIAGLFGALCLDQHFRFRLHGKKLGALLGPLFYLLALLSSEAAIAFAGYAFAFMLFAERGPLLKRALGFAPYLLITVLWRAAYNAAGYGGSGSGLYLDPVRAPVQFGREFLERGPILLLGQFLVPPSEVSVILGGAVAKAILLFAVIFVLVLGAALIPMLMHSRTARFWTAGMLFALVPAGSTYPHNRQLMFVSFGAMALIALFWQRYVVELKGIELSRPVRLAGGVGAMLLGAHAVLSPLALPFTVCSVALTRPLHSGITDVGDEIRDRTAVFVTAPDYFSVKLIQLERRVEKRPLPEHWRVLSFGPVPVVVSRSDARTLVIDYEGGILGTPFLELYRDRRLRMAPGDQVNLEGLAIRVLRVTSDGRADRVSFRFDRPLDEDSFRFYAWRDRGFSAFAPPAIGASATLPAAEIPWGFK